MALGRILEHETLTGALTLKPSEGGLIADTVLFERGKTRDELAASMITMQNKLVDQTWAKRPPDSILNTKEEMLTLASIVEKETAVPEERPKIAAVFLNRLKQGMRLQSDPTIIYGIVGGKGKLDRSLTRSDIDTPTPYNTYSISGLPPGPIAIPGKAALEAVMTPAQVPYLYFVADGTGAHAFAVTLDEHNANVRKWRQIESQQGASAEDQQLQADDTMASPSADSSRQPVVQPTVDPVASLPETQLPAPQEAAESSSPIVPDNSATGLEDALPEVIAPETSAASAVTPPSSNEAQAVSEDTVKPSLSDEVISLKPGSVINTGAKLIPVPAPRPANL
jgi:UPF0755 protein